MRGHMSPPAADLEARFQRFHLNGEVTACMWCGCFVIEPLHIERCAGEERHHEDEAISQELFEEAVTEGLYDDEETPLSEFTGAHQAAVTALLEPDTDEPDAFDLLVHRYGYETAAAAWRMACNEIDHAAECPDGCEVCT